MILAKENCSCTPYAPNAARRAAFVALSSHARDASSAGPNFGEFPDLTGSGGLGIIYSGARCYLAIRYAARKPMTMATWCPRLILRGATDMKACSADSPELWVLGFSSAPTSNNFLRSMESVITLRSATYLFAER
jgi:hypothetical protein